MADKLAKLQKLIYEIRGQKVMLDSDLAALYGVETFNLNKAVKRNIGRFPGDFMFQLTKEEWENLTFQNGISSLQHGGRRFMPYAFTEQGVAMLAAVLNSPKAIDVNISIMRAFVQLRYYVLSKSETNEQITELRKLLMLYIDAKGGTALSRVIKTCATAGAQIKTPQFVKCGLALARPVGVKNRGERNEYTKPPIAGK
jgi:hypothetical protein